MVKLGSTRITCKKCRSVSVLDNSDVVEIKNHTCPTCGAVMGDNEIRLLMACYMAISAKWLMDTVENGGKFDFNIEFRPDLQGEE